MDLESLRRSHPEFVYESFDYALDNHILKIKFHFHTAPDIDFFPTLEIPIADNSCKDIDNFIFHLGLVELISYWKATCSPKITIKAGSLNAEQIVWWRDLLINGLGEFFYQNKINFRLDNFVSIVSSEKWYPTIDNEKVAGDLILIGGGKDSAVTAELLPQNGNALLLNPTAAALKTAEIAGYNKPIIVKRTLDPKLLQLNKQGYPNGHTPFSAYLSFMALLVARIYGFKNVIVSNEASAGEANLEYLWLSVNHQYSKSYAYEKKLREYASHHLSQKINYFSFLRPLNELQIAALFLEIQKYDLAFNSCNVGRGSYWCGSCAKCAFVYLLFSALSEPSRLRKIFGEKDFFESEKIKQHIKDLTGHGKHKPLDCVGTEEESKMAVKLTKTPGDKEIIARIKNDWSGEHFLPEEYERILKEKMRSVILEAEGR